MGSRVVEGGRGVDQEVLEELAEDLDVGPHGARHIYVNEELVEELDVGPYGAHHMYVDADTGYLRDLTC